MDDFRKRRRPLDGGFFGDDLFSFDDMFHDRLHERIHRIMHEALENMGEVDEDGARSFVYGFRINSGPDGRPVVEEFGNVPKNGEVQVSGDREPLVDVIDGKDEITVIAEVPGVEKKDIDLKADGRSLSISVESPQRRYHKELEMPAEIEPDSVRASYKNGILEVKIRRREGKADEKRRIKVD